MIHYLFPIGRITKKVKSCCSSLAMIVSSPRARLMLCYTSRLPPLPIPSGIEGHSGWTLSLWLGKNAATCCLLLRIRRCAPPPSAIRIPSEIKIFLQNKLKHSLSGELVDVGNQYLLAFTESIE